VKYAQETNSPTVIHALARTTAHEKCSTVTRETTTRDRFDARATSLTNRMIRMPNIHHCLVLADIGEARMREIDSRLASRCLPLNRGEQTHPIASRWYRFSFLFPSSALFLFFPLKPPSPLFHESIKSGREPYLVRFDAFLRQQVQKCPDAEASF
jgi:hypothetical protein